MRGRRAFIILTIYLLLLGGFALMVEQIMEQSFQNPFAGASATAGPAIGQAIFAAVLLLMTLQVVFLAPSSTAGAISPRAREADARTPRDDADQLVRDRDREAALGARLRLPAHRRLDPADGGRVRVRRRRARGHRPRLHRADRRRPSVWVRSVCSARASSSARPASTAITIFGVLAITIGTVFLLVFWQAMGSFDSDREPPAGAARDPHAVPARLDQPVPRPGRRAVRHRVDVRGGWCSVVQGLAPTTTTTA